MRDLIELIKGRLYQWDTGRFVRVTPCLEETVDEVHFYYEGSDEALRPELKVDGDSVLAPIPNILLQENQTLIVCAVSVTENGQRTTEINKYRIYERAKPSNYVYTETEVLTIERVVENALTKAKESGDFDGEDGYTPQKYVDYWTEADKAEIKSYVDEAISGGAW